MSTTDSLIASALTWIENDPDAQTRAELSALVRRARGGAAHAGDAVNTAAGGADSGTDSGNRADGDAALAELADRFAGPLQFGTAGLRAALGAGPNRMNRVVVAQTSAGFARFLLGRAGSVGRSPQPSVVIGFDGRTNSDVFARDAAQVFQGAGVHTILLPEPTPTPVTAFAVRHFSASAGVMITASHNPPGDNGYKVYLGDADAGSQIIPPVDTEIAAAIADFADTPFAELARSTDVTVADHTVIAAYIAQTAARVRAHAAPAAEQLRIAYTAMHGVGSRITQQVFQAADLPTVTPVAQQDAPDPEFPTVSFPNPEEPGALDLALAVAADIDAELVIAHDPDADRLAVALPSPAAAATDVDAATTTDVDAADSPRFTALTGNQLGLVLGWRMAERARAAGRTGTLACTIVSSPALRNVARHFGFDYRETLSGFKWVSRVPGLVFGFEEALGYLVHPDVVRDKDGISASAEVVQLALELKSRGETLWDLLDEISRSCGTFASGQVTLRLAHRSAVEALAERIRQHPPRDLGGVAVDRVTDLREPGRAEVPANVLRYDLADGARVMIRPSGTEPKLKLYLDCYAQTGSPREQKATADAALTQLTAAVHAYLAAQEVDHGA